MELRHAHAAAVSWSRGRDGWIDRSRSTSREQEMQLQLIVSPMQAMLQSAD